MRATLLFPMSIFVLIVAAALFLGLQSVPAPKHMIEKVIPGEHFIK